MNRILIIDDEPAIRMLLARILELEGYEVLKAKDRATAIYTLTNNEVQVVLCDVFLPDGNGVDMVQELQRLAPVAKIILLTAHGNITDGVQAIKNGAFDYIVKGDDNRKIIPIVSRAMDAVAAEQKKQAKKSNIPSVSFSFDNIIGRSPMLADVISQARKVAATDVSVLINGETGTGKEVFARAIHGASHRSDGAFLALNCSAFSRELLESELFGYKAGAFTGAIKDKKGLLEEANHGTVFLDEIGDMSLSAQAKVLRALQENEITRVGSDKPIKVNVRVLAATNKDLKKEIAEGRFREDLFHRLNVIPIHVPSLDDRKEDIPLLVNHFAELICNEQGWKVKTFDHAAVTALQEKSWPGNIRELRNVIERLIILGGDTITASDVTCFA